MEQDKEHGLCKVCYRQFSRYTCPRCNLKYCSLVCYKDHSQRCTEEFYRDSATSELMSIRATKEQQLEMQHILQRFHEQTIDDIGSSDEDADSEDRDEHPSAEAALSEDTIDRVQTQANVSVGDLTAQELQAFEHDIATGQAADLLREWRPWWSTDDAAHVRLSPQGVALVTAVNPQEDDAGAGQHILPGGILGPSTVPSPPLTPLPPLTSLTRSPPSPLLRHHLLELLYAYAFVHTMYLGDCATDALEASQSLLDVAPSLTNKRDGASTRLTASSVLCECVERCTRPPLGDLTTRAMAWRTVEDVATLLRWGRCVVLLALLDMTRVLQGALECLRGSGGVPKQKVALLKAHLKAAHRKLLYFQSWCNEQPADVFHALHLEVAQETSNHAPRAPQGQDSVLSLGQQESSVMKKVQKALVEEV